MARYSIMFVSIILMLVFGIFFGIELATRGIEQIQGPVIGTVQQPSHTPSASNASTTPAASSQEPKSSSQSAAEQPKPLPQPKPQPQPLSGDSGINRAGNEIGDMLQSAAHGTIRTIVSLLDSIVN
ncbi:MAG: hypothetical protein K0Q59_1053, partial [Paenibacillus sp.]|jgi:cytoskeletal protein RodZ|nr:hypothetical protein [Paenibacillus sp.]